MTTELAWPATRWTLPAAETVALLAAPRHPDGAEVARRLLMELTARRAVRVVRTRRRGWVRGRREVAAFVDGSGGPPASGLLAGAWRVYREAGAETFGDGARGVDVRRLVRLLWDRYGSADGLGRAASEALAARRLATVVETRRYGIGRHRTFPRTPAGEQAAADPGAGSRSGASGTRPGRPGARRATLPRPSPSPPGRAPRCCCWTSCCRTSRWSRRACAATRAAAARAAEVRAASGRTTRRRLDLGLDLDLGLAELGDLGDPRRWTPSGSASTAAAGMVAAVAEATAAAERAP